MNKFELFSLIFLALDADWDDTKDPELGQFLSSANPFLFGGSVSAVRDVFEDFCSFVGDTSITTENSFQIAKDYIRYIDIEAVSRSFSSLEENQWMDAAAEYLSGPHKGAREVE